MKFAVTALLLSLVAACSSSPAPAKPAAAADPAPTNGTGTIAGKVTPGAIVTMTPATAQDFPLPGGSAVLDQYAKRFVPELLLARVGQPVDFLNSDEFGHNVIVNRRSTGASVFTTSIDKGQKYTHAFDRTGEYTVTCDLHEGMLAIIYVTATPFSATADPAGAYTIAELPPGKYTMVTVVPGGGTTEKPVDVAANHFTRLPS